MTTLLDIGTRLKAHRKKQGLTLSALAERSHVHRNTLSALENGLGNVELKTLLAVCEQLGLGLSFMPAALDHFLPKAQSSLYDLDNLYVVSPEENRKMPALHRRIQERLHAAEPLPDASSRDDIAAPATAPAGTPFQRNLTTLRKLADAPQEDASSKPAALERRIQARLAAAAPSSQKGRK